MSLFSVEEFRDLTQHKEFCAAHLNVRSLNKHFDDVTTLLPLLSQLSLLAFSETWLTNENTHLFSIEGYTAVFDNRPERGYGGVAMYIKEGLPFKQRTDLKIQLSLCESLFVERPGSLVRNALSFRGSSVIVGVLYKSPSVNNLKFLNELERIAAIAVDQ